jgi:hypothetical protein
VRVRIRQSRDGQCEHQRGVGSGRYRLDRRADAQRYMGDLRRVRWRRGVADQVLDGVVGEDTQLEVAKAAAVLFDAEAGGRSAADVEGGGEVHVVRGADAVGIQADAGDVEPEDGADCLGMRDEGAGKRLVDVRESPGMDGCDVVGGDGVNPGDGLREDKGVGWDGEVVTERFTSAC